MSTRPQSLQGHLGIHKTIPGCPLNNPIQLIHAESPDFWMDVFIRSKTGVGISPAGIPGCQVIHDNCSNCMASVPAVLVLALILESMISQSPQPGIIPNIPRSLKGGLDHISRKLYIFFVTSHNFFPFLLCK